MIFTWCFIIATWILSVYCRDEEKIMKSCYWPNEVYEPCFGGCAEISCDNPRNHLRPCYPFCEPGCICEDPYVRDDRTHQCVLPQDCTPTQMGIPVPTRHPVSNQSGTRYSGRSARNYNGREYPPSDVHNTDVPGNRVDSESRRTETRPGNYFNIVIAPPVKPIQPRKMLRPDMYGSDSPKRM